MSINIYIYVHFICRMCIIYIYIYNITVVFFVSQRSRKHHRKKPQTMSLSDLDLVASPRDCGSKAAPWTGAREGGWIQLEQRLRPPRNPERRD